MSHYDAKPRISAHLLSLGLAATGIAGLLAASSVTGVQVGDRVAFDRAPRLIRSATSSSSPNTSAHYQFTIEVPADAGEPLQAVQVTPHNHVEDIVLDHDDSEAFEGDSFAGGPDLPLSSIGGPTTVEGEALFVFDPPVMPGRTVTIELDAENNPAQGGVYQYGITAYPTGPNGIGMFLGYGRLHLFDNN
ncbi:MAG: DUF2808 domain-containing protein [Elainellaceae cyanobacterium]